jgi:signal transduction histidine kinase
VTAQDIDSSYQFVRRIEEIARQVIKELRLLIFELRPLDLQQEGLPGALQLRLASVEQRAGIHTRLLVEEYTAAPVLVEEGLFRIAIEALNNSLKHAEASEVTVQLRRSTGKIMLEILDNGKGFAPGMEDNGGNGLPNMRARALAIGGEMEIASAPGAGTTVIISLEDLNGR